MRQFFKFTFASMLGMLLAIMLVVIVFIGIVGAIISSAGEKKIIVKENSILHIKLDDPISDRASSNPFENISLTNLQIPHELGLNDILKALHLAKEDNKIKGIFLDINTVSGGIATLEEIRDALIDFKRSKKFIWSYSEGYSQAAYYLASVSDSVFLNPQALLEWKGLAAQVMFYKGALEKLDVEPEIIRHGKFKSAVEPLMLDKMSEANRIQTATYLQSIWSHLKKGVARQRKLDEAFVQKVANDALIHNAKGAVDCKFVDRLAYRDEVLENLRKKTDASNIDKINFITLGSYINKEENKDENPNNSGVVRDKIAVVYAIGDINMGEGNDKEIGSERISKAIRDARLDNNIKAIVLRVNSPGGSSLASDVIWREVVLAKKTKPVVVSMGNVAASGGYYISCAADAIVADPTTITGSIGVFGVLFNGQKLLNNKLGIYVDTVKTARYADIGSTYRPLTASERDLIQMEVEHIYDDFITKVAEGRKMTKAQVDSIGQGRVWSGIDAKRIGLIDDFGGLEKAIEIAAGKAKIKEYRISNLPRQDEPLEAFIKEFSGKTESAILKNQLGENYRYYDHFNKVLKNQGILSRMEYEIEIH